ncbi:MAG: hypothetical protein HUU10_15500 [Bacteroidetes bacterium]|nr:hypothetical protein [Bacteroidota bacterium]
MKTLNSVIASTFLLFIGCTDYKAKVESDTKWSGSFGGRTVDGSGNSTIDLDDDGIQCCTVQKETSSGRLKVTIIDDSFLGSDGDSKETTAKYGVVTACSE